MFYGGPEEAQYLCEQRCDFSVRRYRRLGPRARDWAVGFSGGEEAHYNKR